VAVTVTVTVAVAVAVSVAVTVLTFVPVAVIVAVCVAELTVNNVAVIVAVFCITAFELSCGVVGDFLQPAMAITMISGSIHKTKLFLVFFIFLFLPGFF
jgi:hypothetical protein